MQTKEVSIKFTDGMSTKTNDQLATKLELLQNATLEKTLTPRKRHGTTSLTKDAPGLQPSLSAVVAVDNYNGQLVAEDRSGLYSYDQGQLIWSQKSTMPRSTYEAVTVIQENGPAGIGFQFFDYAEVNGYKIITTADPALVGNSVLYVVDSSNNVVYNSKADIGTIVGRIKPIVIGVRLLVVQMTGAGFIDIGELYFNFPGAGFFLSTGLLSLALTNTLPQFDVCAISATKIAICYYDGANLKAITANSLVTAVITLGDSVLVDASAVNTGAPHIVWDSVNALVWIAYFRDGGATSQVGSVNYNSSLVLQNAFGSAETIATTDCYTVGLSFPNTATKKVDIFYQVGTAIRNANSNFLTNAYVGPFIVISSGRIYSKPFVYNSISQIIISRYEPLTAGTKTNQENSCFYIIDSNRVVSARFMRGFTYYKYTGNSEFLVSPSFLNNKLNFVAIGRDTFASTSTFETLKNFANVATIEYESLKKSKSINLNLSLFIAGANPTVFDGNIEYEQGFLHSPHITSVVPGAAGLPNGAYRYLVTYEYTNFRGQVVVSSSAEFLYNNTTTKYGDVSIFTYKLGALTNCRVVLYRTELNGDTFYRIGDTFNSKDIQYFVINDTIPDSLLVERRTYYFPGPVLDNEPPSPFSAHDLIKNRIFTIAADKLNYCQYTKEKDFDLDPGYNEFLRIVVEDNSVSVAEKLTAVSVLDDKIVFFKESTIMYSVGDGPDNSGDNGEFSRPQVISYDVGCVNPRCLALTPAGLMFVSKKGIYALTRGIEIQYIGEAVEVYNNLTFSSAVLDEKRNLVYFSTTTGPLLVYDYYSKQWSVFENYSANDLAMVGDQLYHSKSAGLIKKENANYDDDGSFVPMIIKTNWIKMSGVQNFGRAKRLLFLGEYVSAHNFKCSLSYDYEKFVQDTYTLVPQAGADYNIIAKPSNTAIYTGTIDGVYQWKIHLKKQKCEAIKIMIEDIETSAQGESFRSSDMTFEVGLKEGPFKTQYKKTGVIMNFFEDVGNTVAKGYKKITGTEGYGGAVTSRDVDPYYAQAQQGQAQQLEQIASGQAPSYAEEATKNMLARNLAAQQVGIRSIGGISGALKQRMAANAASRAGTEMARSGGEAALSERMQVRGLLANALAAGRTGNLQDAQAQQANYEAQQKAKADMAKTYIGAAGQAAGGFMAKK